MFDLNASAAAAVVGVMVLAGLALTDHAGANQPATIDQTPEQYLRGARSNAEGRIEGEYTGQFWYWHARVPMQGFLDAYRATGDTAWLDAAVEYFDWCLSLLHETPDGYQAWLGEVIGHPDRIGEHPVCDAVMYEPMLAFAALVLVDEPELADAYGDNARQYVEQATESLFEKWDARGIWKVDGPYGAYTGWPYYFPREEPGPWRRDDSNDRTPGTLPHNMNVKWGSAALDLYRITGDQQWRDRAEKIFNFVKSRLNLYDGHYSWSYRDPFGPWDVSADDPQDYRFWINTHPYRDYQQGEVSAMVRAYNHGVTFDETDMRRLVKTNLEVMWNGDLDDPQWNNSNAGVQLAAHGEIRRPDLTESFPRYAGTLWTALVPFDERARELRERSLSPGSIEYALYHNVTARQEPGYERKHGDLPVQVFDFPFHDNSTLTMVAVLPASVERGQPVIAGCQARIAGELTVELRSGDSSQILRELHHGQQRIGVRNVTLETADLEPGTYRIRWTLRGEYREFPFEVR